MPLFDHAQGPEFWNAAGFVGTFASDRRSEDEDSDEDDEEDCECGAPAGSGCLLHDDGEWNDEEPVLEICEPVDGGEARVVTHASQRAFEESEGSALAPLPTLISGRSINVW